MEGSIRDILDHAKETKWPILNLSHRDLKVVPAEIAELNFLKVLLLNNNGLLLPPEEIASLHCLEHLSLEENALTLLPSGIGSLRALSFLNLSCNKLCCLPSSVSNLTALTELWLSNLELDCVPPELNSLSNLEVLSLSHNCITCVPPEFCLSMAGLRWLSFAGNKLTSLDSCISKFTSLKVVVLDANLFLEIPQVLLSMDHLDNVSLRRNRIGQVSPLLSDVLISSARFSKLDLRENDLQEQTKLNPPWTQLDFVVIDR